MLTIVAKGSGRWKVGGEGRKIEDFRYYIRTLFLLLHLRPNPAANAPTAKSVKVPGSGTAAKAVACDEAAGEAAVRGGRRRVEDEVPAGAHDQGIARGQGGGVLRYIVPRRPPLVRRSCPCR